RQPPPHRPLLVVPVPLVAPDLGMDPGRGHPLRPQPRSPPNRRNSQTPKHPNNKAEIQPTSNAGHQQNRTHFQKPFFPCLAVSLPRSLPPPHVRLRRPHRMPHLPPHRPRAPRPRRRPPRRPPHPLL